MNPLGMNLLQATKAKVEGEIKIAEANLKILLEMVENFFYQSYKLMKKNVKIIKIDKNAQKSS